MKNLFRKILISLLLFIILIPLFLYFFVFHGELSKDINDWMTFGTIWGSVFTGLSILILVTENIKNKDNQLFQKVLEIHDIQIKRIQENDTRKNLIETPGTLSVHTGNDTYFSYFNNLMKDEIKQGIVSILYETIEKNNNFLDDENLKNFFFSYIADQIDVPEEYFIKYFSETKELSEDEKSHLYEIWNKSNKNNISKNYIHGLSFRKSKNELIGMVTINTNPDHNFEKLLEKSNYDKTNVLKLYSEAYENVYRITNELLDAYFIAHKNAVKSLQNDKEKLNDYFQVLSPDEKKSITYYLLIQRNNVLTEIHLNNNFFSLRNKTEYKYISRRINKPSSFYEDLSKYVFGINNIEVLRNLLS